MHLNQSADADGFSKNNPFLLLYRNASDTTFCGQLKQEIHDGRYNSHLKLGLVLWLLCKRIRTAAKLQVLSSIV